jgi:hypothetical protein
MVTIFTFLMVIIVLMMLISGQGPAYPQPSDEGSDTRTEVVLQPIV